jgi:tRNA U34 5-methylaminomethyl-2-thiouridine-forming methyltransferase MnmC
MEKITTKDGSITYFNDEFQEHYHSLTGASEEAREKYAVPALSFINEKLKDKDISVLDFCYGLGYNSIIFIDELRKSKIDVKVEVVGIDNDIEIVSEGKKILRELIDKRIYSDDKVFLKVELGDASKIIKKLDNKFDICFFDPFSIKKCPKLWTEEVFKDVFKLMKKPSILLTYSCARLVRENMKKAGFIIKDGPCIGRNTPSTIAIKK